MTKKKTPEKLTYLLQEDKALEMLELYNALDSMLDEASETFDIDLSTLRNLRHQTWVLKETFSFKPQKHDEYEDNLHIGKHMCYLMMIVHGVTKEWLDESNGLRCNY